MNPADLSIAEAAAALRKRRLTSVALTEAHLTRIEYLNPRVRAFTTLTEALAMATAKQADADFDAGIDRGALHGIPFGIKDMIDMAGLPTACGSHAHPGHTAERDAAVVSLMRARGAVPLGKLATYEYALVGPSSDGPAPAARNPWDPDRITGGSSSGSAAAVASGLVRLALGTDTGGSARSPAAYCGVVGLKPTHGLLSTEGVFPLSRTLDHVGLLGATVTDVSSAFFAMAGGSPAPGDLAGMRLGFARDWVADDPAADPGVIEATDAAASTLSMLGASIRLIKMPDYATIEAAGALLIHAEALGTHREWLSQSWQDYGRQARQSLAAGLLLAAEDVSLAKRAAVLIRNAVDAALSDVDALVSATVLTPAPAVPDPAEEKAAWTAMRTLPFNLTGHPALTVPCGFVEGMPVGLQILGRHGEDATVLRIGAAFEAASDHAAQRPQPLA